MPSQAETVIAVNVIGFVLATFLICAIVVAGAVFLGLCVYNDARYRQNPNAGLWGVLSGFFSIAALIYLIVTLTTKDQPRRCVRCGNFLPSSYPGYPGYPGYNGYNGVPGYNVPGGEFCPFCGQPAPFLHPAEAELYARRRKRYLILWIGSMILAVVLAVASAVMFIMAMTPFAY